MLSFSMSYPHGSETNPRQNGNFRVVIGSMQEWRNINLIGAVREKLRAPLDDASTLAVR